MERNDIDCPHAQTWMTPCISRDGHLALADDLKCVGCSLAPDRLLKDLAKRYEPASGIKGTAQEKADTLTRLVAEYVANKG